MATSEKNTIINQRDLRIVLRHYLVIGHVAKGRVIRHMSRSPG